MEWRRAEKKRGGSRWGEEKAGNRLRGCREGEEGEGWRVPLGGRNLEQLSRGPTGCPTPTPGLQRPLGPAVWGIDSDQERASRMGEFGRAWAPLKDLAFPADSAPPPS